MILREYNECSGRNGISTAVKQGLDGKSFLLFYQNTVSLSSLKALEECCCLFVRHVFQEGICLMVSRIDYSEFINEKTLFYYCNTNEGKLGETKVTSILVELPGLGGSSCIGGSINRGVYEDPYTEDFAKHGIVVAYIFPGPWSWGNRAAVRITDSVVAALAKKYQLKEPFPLGVTGGSMGGLGSLIYSADSSYKINAVASACPCTNVLTDFAVLDDFPRTYISAVAGYDMDPEEALKSISPLYRLDDLQDTAYFICSDAKDTLFPEEECDLFVEKMHARSLDVIYRRQPEQGHGCFLPEVRQEFHEFLLSHLTVSKS